MIKRLNDKRGLYDEKITWWGDYIVKRQNNKETKSYNESTKWYKKTKVGGRDSGKMDKIKGQQNKRTK